MRKFCSTVFFAAMLAATASHARAQEPNFGRALALTATELFIGQPVNWYGPGIVYGYRVDASEEWRERSRLMASDSARMDDFGRSLAVDGNTLVIGAPRKRGGSGVAYAFERASAGADWRQVAIIEPPGAGDHSEYASALALSGADLLIGAPAADSTGVVYHFRRTGGSWRLHGVIRPGSETGAVAFGRTMSQEGEWLLVGAPAADSGAGKVFFSRRQANGEWGEPTVANLPQSARSAGARVGSAVLLNGDTAYIGAPGAATVFVLVRDSAGVWSSSGELHPFDASRGTQFGYSLGVVGGEVWIGAPGVNGSNGRVYRFIRDAAGGWRSAHRFDADSADGTSWPFAFGFSIASAGDRAVVGMPLRDFGEGRALVVAREGGAWQPRQLLEGQIFSIGRTLTPGARCE
ncbi:MAG: FG-GAP repeat protein, partial [Longimicrobiales bacterium]